MNYYRRVWEWKGSAWVVIGQGYFEYYGLPSSPSPSSQLPCVHSFDYKTAGCSIGTSGFSNPDPPLYEIWWQWIPATWGSGSGKWHRVAGGANYK